MDQPLSLTRLPKFADIIKAHAVLKSNVKKTPLERSKSFSNLLGANVYMKLENLQSTGSFKVRGANYKISCLPKE